MRRHDPLIIVLAAILTVVLFTVSLLWIKFQWDECRKESDSIWFCLQHVS